MKTILLLIASSLFLSNMPNNKENDSIEKVMSYRIEKFESNKSHNANASISRTPIIIVKRD